MKERTLKNLRNSLKGKVYVYLEDDETRSTFLSDAAAEGYRFGSCGLPERIDDNIISLGGNRQLSYVGYIGRIAFQCNGGSGSSGRFYRIDYARYKLGYRDYYKDPSLRIEKVSTAFHGKTEIVGAECEKAARFFSVASKLLGSYDEEEDLIDLISKKYNVITACDE